MKILVSISKSTTRNKIISRIYKCILQFKSENMQYIKEKLEMEGSFNISEEDWRRICKAQRNSTISLQWRKFSWQSIDVFIMPCKNNIRKVVVDSRKLFGINEANHFHISYNCQFVDKALFAGNSLAY